MKLIYGKKSYARCFLSIFLIAQCLFFILIAIFKFVLGCFRMIIHIILEYVLLSKLELFQRYVKSQFQSVFLMNICLFLDNAQNKVKMKYLILFLMLIILSTFIYGKSRTLTHILKYYETISKLDIQHHISRREIDSTDFVKEISFFSHKEQFELKLRSSDEIFAPDFEAVAIDKDGVERKIDIHKHAYYKGHDIQHENAKVFAHVENGMLTASIYAKNETYIIEPMWRHDNSLKNEMLVYKFSNVNWNFTDADMKGSLLHPMTCGVNSSEKSLPTTEGIFHSRKRREIVTEKNTCQLILVADYLFYKNMGNENKQTTIDYMLQVADRVNRIFRETEWSVGKNIGFQVRKTVVYDGFTQTPRYSFCYLMFDLSLAGTF